MPLLLSTRLTTVRKKVKVELAGEVGGRTREDARVAAPDQRRNPELVNRALDPVSAQGNRHCR